MSKKFTIGRLKEEWQLFKQPIIIWGIVVGAIMQFLHNAAHNLVYYLAGEYDVYGGPSNQLVDLGFKLLQPSIENLSFLPSNGCLYSLGVIAVIVAGSPLFTHKIIIDKSVHVIQIIWRALIVCGITIILRCVSFLVTILPAPAPQCAQATFDPPTGATEMFFSFNTEDGCSDLIFSSHMMYGIIASSIVIHYMLKDREKFTKKERIWKYMLSALCVSLNIAEAFCIVAQNRHYSVDVFTSCYAVPLTWIAFNHFVPKDPGSVSQPKTNVEPMTNENNSDMLMSV